MTSKKPLILNSGHSQTNSLGKVKESKVIEAFSLSDVRYILGLLRANGVTVDNWNHHPQMHPLEGNILGDQTGRVVGSADPHGDVLAPCLNSMI